ncbi:hypothetical protein ACFQ4Z_02110 [Oceanobacillus oncorhynchi subsp. oncorhynchi]|uniref:hypothetical protein n=1 Tax=Oceanobacillus oncorhynchi TaxID=545501 RepID=UPI003644F25B
MKTALLSMIIYNALLTVKIHESNSERGSNSIEGSANDSLSSTELINQLLEMKDDRIGLLEGNISSLLSLLAVIFTVIAVIAIFIGWYLRKRFDDQLGVVENIREEVRNEKNEIKTITRKSENLAFQISQTHKFLSETEHEVSNMKQLFIVKTEDIDQLKVYLQYLEYLNSNHKIVLDYFVERDQFNIMMDELEGYKQSEFIHHSRVVLKVKEELGIYNNNEETVVDKINYLYSAVQEEEKKLQVEIKKFKFEYEEFYDSFLYEGTSEPHSDLIAKYIDWKYTLEQLEIILNWIKAVSTMNSQGD